MTDPADAATYFQAIPLYFTSDTSIATYFREHAAEIDAVTGESLTILLPREVSAGDAGGVATVFSDGQKRYPGLGRGDLPCFWLEDGAGGHEVLRPPSDPAETIGFVRRMADVARTARDTAGFRSALEAQARADAAIRNPEVRATEDLAGATRMAAWEKIVAVVCGVAFVIVILVMAVAIPAPSPFQYIVFRIVLAVAVAGFASTIPGMLGVELPFGVKAGGALAVLVIVYFFNPATLVTPPPDTAPAPQAPAAKP